MLQINLSENEQLKELHTKTTQIKEDIVENKEFSLLKFNCLSVLELFAGLFHKPEQGALKRFIELTCEIRPLVNYLYSCEDMDFEDLLDVIDDT